MNGRNPLLPASIHIPDGEAHKFGNDLYIYGSLDEAKDHYCSESYRVVHTSDMRNFDVGDTSFSESQVPWEIVPPDLSWLDNVKTYADLPEYITCHMPKISRFLPIKLLVKAIRENSTPKTRMLYAPDCMERDGKYYLYFCLSDNTEGVAVASNPMGPFGDVRKIPAMGIDPAIFLDDDGQAYYYWGQFQSLGAKLKADMVTLDEGTIVKDLVTEREHHFHEGSSMRKRGGIYYYVFADISRDKPTCLGYATSDSPLGPFTYRGVIVDNCDCDPKSWNNHGCIEEINGQWYVFYHRCSGNSNALRRLCVEKIEFDENGLIPEVKMTSIGAGEPFAPGEEIPARTACALKNGAYINLQGQEEVLYLPGGGEAVFRYAALTGEETRLLPELSGEGSLAIYGNDSLLGRGTGGEIGIRTQQGLTELRLVNAGKKSLWVKSLRLQ